MGLPKELLEVLACPFCKSDIKEENDIKLACTNTECCLKYPVKKGIPVMLIDEAERPCPKCGTQRDFKDEKICCPKCNATILFRRITPK